MLFLFLEYYFNMYAPNLICSYPVSFSDFFPRESSCLVMHMEDNDPVRGYVTIIYYWSMSWWQELFSCLLVLNSLTDFFIKIFCWSVCTGFFCSMSLHNVQIVSSSSWWWTDQFERCTKIRLKKYRHLLEKWSLYLFSERGDLIWWIDQGQLFPEEAASQPQSVEYGLRCCCCCLPWCILSYPFGSGRHKSINLAFSLSQKLILAVSLIISESEWWLLSEIKEKQPHKLKQHKGTISLAPSLVIYLAGRFDQW